jgi:hypothetical protein
MMRSFFLLAASCLLLAGCTDADWSNTMSTLGLGDSPSGMDMPAQAPQPDGSSWLGTGASGSAARAAPVTGTPAARASAASATGNAAAATAETDALCRASATDDANRNAFDAATRQRVYQLRYAQCRTLLAR